MHRRLFARTLVLTLLAGVAVTTGVPAGGAAAQPADPAVAGLTDTIDTLLADPRLAGSQAAVVVRDATTGEVLYNRNGERRLLPASNTKLLTSAAALEILGPGYRFTTDVRTKGAHSGVALRGDLYLRGTGDPTLLAADYDALAAKVAASGVQVVEGDLVADDTWFDDRRLGTDWAWDDESFYYAAPVSALSVAPNTDYDAGNVILTVRPGAAAGAAPVVTLTPETGVVTIDNRATTAASGGNTLDIERTHGTNQIVVSGAIPVNGAATTVWMSVPEPTEYAADVFRRALVRHGVQVLGGTRLGAATPADARPLATHESMTMTELMVPFLKLSNNGHAEVLTKAIGRHVSGQGTWPAGLAAIRTFVAGMGMDVAAQRQADGSGLSRFNLIPALEFTDLLVAARAKPWFGPWYDALPIAGNPARFVGGTLRTRMRNTPAADNVHAKTGTLTSVSGLSGYVTDADGRRLVFSILLNNQLLGVRDIEDRIAVALASFTAGQVTGQAVPSLPVPAREAPADIECSWVKPDAC
ncbi:MAG TPA: D-alanyl-D-alanine carboxypeptidase/D-alanyl-D-alanine-endopeptidase [Micromonosporaceae bacterium]|nr:D-alanyl-D-alanine carboxypeptidase/D-alanyl-D-alanine-endopeptidase [Micromonosporaceae bacterium]